MKKILFISTRYPVPVLGGDKIRAVGILKYLSKKNKIDLVCLSGSNKLTSNKFKFCNKIRVFKINIFQRLFGTLISFFKLEPLQVGFYNSEKMKKYINKNCSDYHTIIFHTLRSCQYQPKNFKGKKILEMTDLLSLNYKQTFSQMSILNPLKYIYFFENILVKKYEKKVSKLFDSFVFVSKEDLKKTKNYFPRKKTFFIRNGCEFNRREFKFSKMNNKILFVGNIKYLPNKYACYDFAKNILPRLNNVHPEIKFHIVGETNFYDKYKLGAFKNVYIHGPVKNIKQITKNNICGICNLKIATGFQNKIVNYMSYGIPTVSSFMTFKGLDLKKNKEIAVYKTNDELIKKISEIKKSKIKSVALSYYGHKAIKKRFNWNKTLLKYNQII